MTKIVDLNESANRNYLLLLGAIEGGDDKQLLQLIRKNLNLDVRFKHKNYPEDYNPSPLMEAVRCNNAYAVRLIGNKMKMDGTIDLSQEIYSESLLHSAIRNGNPEIVRYLLSYGAVANLSSAEETPIMTAVRVLPTFSLIQDGEWNSEADKNALLDWYNGKGEFPKAATTLKWRGSLNVIKQLLEADADCTVQDNCNVAPTGLMNSLTDPAHIQKGMFSGEHEAVEFISATNDEITFKITLLNRDGTKRHPVTVTYNVCEVRALLDKYKDKNKHKGVDSKKLKDLETALAECKAKAERHEVDLKPVRKERKAAKEEQTIMGIIYKYEGLKSFYVEADKHIYNKSLVAGGLLRTGMLTREHYAKADMVADGLSAAGGIVPIFGNAAKGAAFVVQKGSDINERRNHKHYRKNLPETKMVQAWTNKITIELTKHFAAELMKLSAERAEKFSEIVSDLVYDTLVDKEYEDNTVQKTSVMDIVIEAVKQSESVKKKLDSLMQAQTKDDKKQQETLAKQELEAQKAQAIAAKRKREKAQLDLYTQYRAANRGMDADDVVEDAATQRKECVL